MARSRVLRSPASPEGAGAGAKGGPHTGKGLERSSSRYLRNSPPWPKYRGMRRRATQRWAQAQYGVLAIDGGSHTLMTEMLEHEEKPMIGGIEASMRSAKNPGADYDLDRKLWLPRRGFISLACAVLAGTVLPGWPSEQVVVDTWDFGGEIAVQNLYCLQTKRHWRRIGLGGWVEVPSLYAHGELPIVVLR